MTETAAAHQLLGAIQRAGARTADVDEFFGEVSDQVRKVVPFDGSMWFGVDPSTMLASAPARIENMDSSFCWPFWMGEFHDADTMLFRDLARQPVPVGALRIETGGSPLRSPRYREFMRPQGYDDEARVAFRAGGTTWAVAALYREQGREAFGAAELDVLASISNAVALVLRDRHVVTAGGVDCLSAPGVLLFDGDARLVSANREAKTWLWELYGPDCEHAPWSELLAQAEFPEQLMRYPILQSLVARARAVARGYDQGPARLRLRDRGGRWVVLHASALDPTTQDGPVAVVVEPAKSSEVAPIVVEAYGLTSREREVLRGVSRGLSTPEIAAELFLSGHTVRDYIKSVFEKVGVSSRGELIAKLFAEHYADSLHARAVHVD